VAEVTLLAGGQLDAVSPPWPTKGPERLGRISRANGITPVSSGTAWSIRPTPRATSAGRQVRGINHQRSGGGNVIDQRVLAYDPAQNKILRAQTLPFRPRPVPVTNASPTTPGPSGPGRAGQRLHSRLLPHLRAGSQRQPEQVVADGAVQPYAMDATLPSRPTSRWTSIRSRPSAPRSTTPTATSSGATARGPDPLLLRLRRPPRGGDRRRRGAGAILQLRSAGPAHHAHHLTPGSAPAGDDPLPLRRRAGD